MILRPAPPSAKPVLTSPGGSTELVFLSVTAGRWEADISEEKASSFNPGCCQKRGLYPPVSLS